jgi:hypothetical protein
MVVNAKATTEFLNPCKYGNNAPLCSRTVENNNTTVE